MDFKCPNKKNHGENICNVVTVFLNVTCKFLTNLFNLMHVGVIKLTKSYLPLIFTAATENMLFAFLEMLRSKLFFVYFNDLKFIFVFADPQPTSF